MIVELLVNLVCKGSDYPCGKQMKPIFIFIYKPRELLIKKDAAHTASSHLRIIVDCNLVF